MLDNEPTTTEAAETVAPAQEQQPTARRTVKKAAAKKTTTTRKRTATKAVAAEEVPTQSDGETADPAPVKKAAKKAAAKKTVTKKAAATTAAKAPAKKTAAKRTTKKAAAAQDSGLAETEAPEVTPADGGPVVESAPAPAKKTTRKRTTKKAAAAPQADLVAEHTPVTDGPVDDAETAAPTAEAAELAVEADAAVPAEAAPQRRTRRRAPAAAAVLFQAPTDVPTQAPAKPAATSPVEATPETGEGTTEPGADEQPTSTRRRRNRRGRDTESRDAEEVAADRAEPVPAATEAIAEETAEDGETAQSEDGEEGGEGTRRRRRRRGGRRRRKSGEADNGDESTDEQSEDDRDEQETGDEADGSDEDQQTEGEDEADGAGSSSRRRRRRRRRKGEDSAASPDDPDETVVRVREPRSKNTANEVTAIEGSTRLEAKKQRRREGRAAGRRRAPIVTEAEFLARRESVERTMVIRSREDLTQIAVSEDNVLVEHYVAQAEQTSLIGNVYLGRVQNVLPSMEAAFIDIGKGRNAVLYAGEVDWATLGGANGPRKIESVLKSGQSVLVQVTKDPIGHKGARLTNQISLPGRYVVYVPRGGNGGISRKLPDTERNRLKGILKDIVPDEAGVIVRTAAEGATEEELTADVSRLQRYWDDIDKKSKNGQSPQLLHGEPDLLIRVVRDLFTEDFTKLVISGDDAYDQVRDYVSDVAPHLADRVEKWTSDGDVFANYRIDEQIKKALDRKVWLPSGGSLIIDRTEAMTVVDVNTGKFTGSGGNLEETVTKNNLEAAEEIVRQLRLRDIGGIIVIDFIDMVLESNRDLVLRRLVECLGRDRTKHQVAEVTSLGLVQMTRKRIGTGLLEAFSENCDHCGGRGLILHDEPKESRRRSESRNGQEQKAVGDEGAAAKKTSRRRGRGRGRAEDEQPEPEPQQHKDVALRVAQIAAASAVTDAKKTDEAASSTAGEPTGYPVSAAGDQLVSPEATGFPDAGVAATSVVPEQVEADTAEQNGSGRSGTRRRRSSRGRGKAAQQQGEAGDSGTGEAAALVSTGN